MNEDKLVTLENPNSSVSEIYRKIRTNIEYASIDKKIKTINITSTNANETKSTTACNLAVMF
ncbi:MAG: capsular exopolysaccharide family, partial [Haloplasmataceae bacterium]|nr:capsular exopolysaccharide family [Haloplasmataceae bacterium]